MLRRKAFSHLAAAFRHTFLINRIKHLLASPLDPDKSSIIKDFQVM
jgi:hypothetical protein